jgi:hypothetical protein
MEREAEAKEKMRGNKQADIYIFCYACVTQMLTRDGASRGGNLRNCGPKDLKIKRKNFENSGDPVLH